MVWQLVYKKINRQALMMALQSVFLISCVSANAKDIQFAKKTIQVGTEKIEVEIADTQEKQARGLMYRKSMPENAGMLFIFKEARPQNFWMKNTFIALDLGFFDSKGKLLEVATLEPMKSEMDISTPASYLSQGPAMYVLEMNKGWFKKKHVAQGAILKTNL